MKIILNLVFALLVSFTFIFAQDENDVKAFKKSSNKYYIGANVSPIFVGLLNGTNVRPEWRIGYKQRLGNYNHYFRLSYNHTNWSNYNTSRFNNRTSYSYYPGPFVNDYTSVTPIDSNLFWRSGLLTRKYNQQVVKVGYEYQFKIGKPRKVSINMGADLMVGAVRTTAIMVNDTTRYSLVNGGDGTIFYYDELVGSNTTAVDKPVFIGGISPMFAVGLPVGKRFDFTVEMAFDCTFLPATEATGYIATTNIDYRPSLMLSYRFDENAVRNKTRNKSAGR